MSDQESNPKKTVVSGPAVVAATKKPAVISFWKQARVYGAIMHTSAATTRADVDLATRGRG